MKEWCGLTRDQNPGSPPIDFFSTIRSIDNRALATRGNFWRERECLRFLGEQRATRGQRPPLVGEEVVRKEDFDKVESW
jgi:hypothetical protein